MALCAGPAVGPGVGWLRNTGGSPVATWQVRLTVVVGRGAQAGRDERPPARGCPVVGVTVGPTMTPTTDFVSPS